MRVGSKCNECCTSWEQLERVSSSLVTRYIFYELISDKLSMKGSIPCLTSKFQSVAGMKIRFFALQLETI